MKVFLISGKAGHGKDTFAGMLQKELEALGGKVLMPHFADLVKFYAQKYLNWNGEKDETGRQLLQAIGNNSFRQSFPSYWAEITAKCVNVMGEYFGFDYAIIPDTRYPNEIDVVKEYNSDTVTVRIVRYNEDSTIWENEELTQKQKENPSETSLDNYAFDYIIENHSLEELQESAEELTKLEI